MLHNSVCSRLHGKLCATEWRRIALASIGSSDVAEAWWMYFIVFASPSLAILFITAVIIKRSPAGRLIRRRWMWLTMTPRSWRHGDVELQGSARWAGCVLPTWLGFNYATTNMNYALGCDLNQSPKYVGLHDTWRRWASSGAMTPSLSSSAVYGYCSNAYDVRGRDSDSISTMHFRYVIVRLIVEKLTIKSNLIVKTHTLFWV